MEAALSIAAPTTAGLPNPGPVPAEGDGEGGFVAALTRSMAEAAPAVPLPLVATPVAMPPVPEVEAAILAERVPAPAPEPDFLPALRVHLPEAWPIASERPMEEPGGDEDDAEPQLRDDALLVPPPPLVIPAPARSSVPIKAVIARPANDEAGEVAPTILGTTITPAIPPLAPPVREALVASPNAAAKAAITQPSTVVAQAVPPAPEGEAETVTPPPDVPVPPQPATADFHTIAPERPAPPAAQISQTPVPPELAGLHAAPRAGLAEATPAAPPPSPIRQVASIAVALAFAPGASNGFRLSLDPAELGRVEIHVQREGDSHSVRVTAERPETLALLQRDRQELDRGLAEAGLRLASTGIDFSLDTPSGGSGQGGGTGQRGHFANTTRLPPLEQAEPPPRVLRSLLDLNI